MKAYETEEERMAARRRSARECKLRKKSNPGDPAPPPKRRYYPTVRDQALDSWWDTLKKKHEGQPRLTHSIKPPIFLEPDKGIGR